MEKTKKVITKLLICFALISIGFALGKKSVKRNVSPTDSTASNGNKSYVVVFYMHSTFRCSSCNNIEKMTKALVDRDYAEELKSGRIQWQDVDFQDNEILAKQFDVIASCVVVATVNNGKYTDSKRLDEVWTLMKDPLAFDKYISKAIDENLKELGGEK